MSYVVTVKSTVKISQNFVAFSEYMNFNMQQFIHSEFWQTIVRNSRLFSAKRKLERLQFSTSSLFVKFWSACSFEFNVYFWTFWALYHLFIDLETIGVDYIIIWWLVLEKKPKWKRREIWIKIVVIFLQLYLFGF